MIKADSRARLMRAMGLRVKLASLLLAKQVGGLILYAFEPPAATLRDFHCGNKGLPEADFFLFVVVFKN